jgi:rhodanese-related sulfurtransferase/glyoxylase-like metal-dependent hydrolase (beta-lactamase superfamily II)
MIFSQHYLGCLSHASYLIGDEATGRAVVVDPRRDIGIYLAEAAAKGLRIERVIETHLHADFLSGHLELAEQAGAVISFGEAADVDFPTQPLVDGQRLSLGEVTLEIRATPGHTPESICVLVFEHPEALVPYGVLTGDTLFVGDVGRPDLLASSGSGFTADRLARLLYHSLHERILDLPDETRIFPAHGAGSACGKQLSSETSSTLGEQRRSNYALAAMTEDDFVAAVTEGQPVRPAYFSFDAQRNREAHQLLDEQSPPPPMDITTVLARQQAGAVALDTREPADFAAAHLRGAINVGLQGRFAEWAGDVLGTECDIILVGDPNTALESRVRLARIGFDRVVGHLSEPGQLLIGRPDLVEASSRVTIGQLAELIGLQPDIQLIDVRNPGETEAGMLPAARPVPLAVLVSSLDEFDLEAPTVVYCAGGYRSLVASSVLGHAGFADVSDLLGGYGAWAAAGLPVSGDEVPGPRPPAEVGPLEAQALLQAGAVLVDVREPEEWHAGHAPQARLVPMGQVEARLGELEGAAQVLVVCRSGGRSAAVTQLLTSRGLNAVNLAGGMRAWSKAGLPVTAGTNQPGEII